MSSRAGRSRCGRLCGVGHVDMSMPGHTIRSLATLVLIATYAIANFATSGSANVAPQPTVDSETREGAAACKGAPHAVDVARTAAKLCGALPVDEALRAVTMSQRAARTAAEVLAELGFGTVLDLELLGGGTAAAEVLTELKMKGLCAADRAKVRLLVGDRKHLRRLSPSPSWSPATADGPRTSTSSKSGLHSHTEDEEAKPRGHQDWSRRMRQLQGADTTTGGISADTIAIVLSVLVGAAGYVVQAQTQRRAERVQQQQAQELHVGEQARQREHQMMTAQIERTHRGLDQCCRPVLNDINAISWARLTMTFQIVARLEVSYPDVAEEMLSVANGVIYELQLDGTVTNARNGIVRWKPNASAELTYVAVGEVMSAAPTGAACIIAGHDTATMISYPYCWEMQSAILGIIGDEPTCDIAETYRSYVRHTLWPLLRRIVDTLRGHAAYVELPTKDWLQATFPEISWGGYTNSVFMAHWYAYTLSFERVLSEWSESNFSSVRPSHPQPWGALFRMLGWSQEKAEARQAELIGMTSVVELDEDVVYGRSRELASKLVE